MEEHEAEAADQRRVARKEVERRIDRRIELEDTAFVLSTIQGRRFYWRILSRCGLFKSSFTGNNTTFFNEGERSIGLVMMADLNEADPHAYLKMLQEARKFPETP